MAGTRALALALGCTLSLTLTGSFNEVFSAEFSNAVTSLPYPPDAKELEFTAWSGDIQYTSQSPLKSLAAFYLKEMATRDWELDESEVEIDDDSIELQFVHDDSQVELRLSQWSKMVRVRLDCEGLDFKGTDDPSKLVAAGIPMPRATVFLQKEIPLPKNVRDLSYDGDGLMLKSTMKLQETFDYFTKQVKSKGFRESRRPIVNDTRRYTEFKKGSIEVSVNVFEHEIGSRLVLEYEDQRGEPKVPPLAAVASLPIKNPGDPTGSGMTEDLAEDLAEHAVARTSINVIRNTGKAIVQCGNKRYSFSHVACFQTRDRGDYATEVVFSAQPIPYNKFQAMLQREDSPSFGDLYEFDFPDYLILQLGKYVNCSFSADGVGIGGHRFEKADNKMEISDGRVAGTFKMEPEEILSRQFSFTASIDAAVMTPSTQLSSGAADPVEKSNHPVLTDSPVPMPEGVEDLSRTGSNFRKEYTAQVEKPLGEVVSFYQTALTDKGWQQVSTNATGESMEFKNDSMELLISLSEKDGVTAIEVVARDYAAARKEGLLPEPGKGRLILANAHSIDVVYTIGKTNYPVKAGQGADNPKDALNYSLLSGTYKIIVKIPGQSPQTERIKLSPGSTWGIIALPTGGYMPMQMY